MLFNSYSLQQRLFLIDIYLSHISSLISTEKPKFSLQGCTTTRKSTGIIPEMKIKVVIDKTIGINNHWVLFLQNQYSGSLK